MTSSHNAINQSLSPRPTCRKIVGKTLRKVHDCYQEVTRPCPSIRTLLPFLFSVVIHSIGARADQRVGLTLLILYLINIFKGVEIDEAYQNELIGFNDSKPFNQVHLLRNKVLDKPSNMTLLALNELPFVGEFLYFSQLTHTATGGKIPSIYHFLDQVIQHSLRQNKSSTLSQLDPQGECDGLGKAWFLDLMTDQEDEFFQNLGIAMTAANSFREVKLTESQENLLKIIHHLQTHQQDPLVDIDFPIRGNKIKISLKIEGSVLFPLKEEEKQTLSSIIEQVINLALKEPGILLGLAIGHAGRGHVINIVAKPDCGTNYIYFFDANKGRARFSERDKEACVTKLTNLLNYKYSDYFTRGGGQAVFRLRAHQAIGLPKPQPLLRFSC